jgi:hypothetical protein
VSQARLENLPVTIGGKKMQVSIPTRTKKGVTKSQNVPVLSPNLIGIGVIEPVSKVVEVLRAAGAVITTQ